MENLNKELVIAELQPKQFSTEDYFFGMVNDVANKDTISIETAYMHFMLLGLEIDLYGELKYCDIIGKYYLATGDYYYTIKGENNDGLVVEVTIENSTNIHLTPKGFLWMLDYARNGKQYHD